MLHSVKAKLANKEKLKQACSTAVSALQTTLRITKEAAGDAAVPGLKASIGGLLLVLDVIKKTSQNADDIERLSKQIQDFNLVLENSKDGGALSPVAIDRINRLFSASNTALEGLRKMASRHAIRRFIHSDDDAQLISGHIQTITWSMQTFMVETTVAIESALEKHAAKTEEHAVMMVEHAARSEQHAVRTEQHAVRTQEQIDNLHETTTSQFQRINARLDTKDEHPPHAIFSPFNCKDRAQCLEGTRADVLDQIFCWVGVGDSQSQFGPIQGREANTVGANTCIFWINGSAGTGKTTIAYTVAEVCRAFDVLGASFFCSRDDADCSNPNMIFTSIAYQLGMFSPLFRAEVTRAMKSNPDIGHTTPPYQLQELIVKPLRTLQDSFSPCLIVLDALDECKETGTTSVILSSLSRHVDELSPLKFLVTSRPESHITTVFKSSELDQVTRRYVLHQVELCVVQSDIKHYLSMKLALTRELYHLENEWPSIADIDALTRMSFGLFIFASTSVKFIEDENYCDPKHQLSRLLCNAPTATENTSPHYNLDQLYGQVLNHAFPDISAHLSGRLKMILGTIVLLRDPLSSLALERLLGIPPRTVRATLQRLHSVILVPDNDTQVIRTLHPSFFDYISNPTRCLNPKYVIDTQMQHTSLACACLDAMKQLKRDICGLRNPSLLNSEVEDLAIRVITCIRPELQYACRHWSWHLQNATFSDNLIDLLNEFCSKYLLYWIEALSLMGDVRYGLLALDAAQKAIAKAERGMTDAKNLLHDCERFAREFSWIISSSSLQIYHSALLFTPLETLMKKIYGRELDLPVKIYNGLDGTWNSCIRTIEGHSEWVESVALSPDGMCIVSGSGDRTVRLWDAVSGAHLNTLKGHSDWVQSVAFSPDGTRIVSGSNDTTLRLWDPLSGAHLNTLEGHSGWVQSVAFSADNACIVSGSTDKTLRLWDAISGAHMNTLEGHSGSVRSVAFSPNGSRIVSGSTDKTLRLWDTVSGANLNTLKGHSNHVRSVAFSPDGMRIVSGSTDNTLRLWDAASGAHLNTLEGHSHWISSVAFSPDGIRVVSGSIDQTIRLWDTVSGAHLNTLEGHSEWVQSVSFSLDGVRIVSGSTDKTLRLWDAVSDAHLNTLERHSDWVQSVAFSPDGTRIVSGSIDQTIRLWDAVGGVHLNTLEGHSNWISSVGFSPDGTRIVSGSGDRTIRLWDTVGGTHLNTLKGHSDWVESVAFSPDGTRIVSGSRDNTVRLWDTASGAHQTTFRGHSGWVQSVAFSPDGIRVVSGSVDGTLCLWDSVSGTHLNTLEGHSNWVESVAFSSDGTRIVSGSSDKTLRLWEAASGAHLDTLTGHFSSVESVARSYSLHPGSNPTGPVFGYIAEDGWVHSITRNRRICWIPVSCRPMSLAANGDRIVFGTADGRVIILDFSSSFRFRNL